MAIKHIPQPYIVYAPWDASKDQPMTEWLEENIHGYFLVTYISNGAWITPKRSNQEAIHTQIEKKVLQFHFECPRDAMLFKLTWGEK